MPWIFVLFIILILLFLTTTVAFMFTGPARGGSVLSSRADRLALLKKV
jgi:hypothetical protein